MDVYKTEEEQVEAIKKWWQENGKSIIAGVVIAAGCRGEDIAAGIEDDDEGTDDADDRDD